MSQLSVLLKALKELQALTPAPYDFPPSLELEEFFSEDASLPLHPTSDTEFEAVYPVYTEPELLRTTSTDSNSEPLLSELYALKTSLDTTGTVLTSHLHDSTFALSLPSLDPTAPYSTSYRFAHWRTGRIYTIHWSLTILVSKMLIKLLPPHNPARCTLETECRAVALEICKTWDNAWANRPIGACHVWLGFVVAYEFCGVEARAWVLRALNRFLVDQGVEGRRWTEEVLIAMCRRLMGEDGGLLSGFGPGELE